MKVFLDDLSRLETDALLLSNLGNLDALTISLTGLMNEINAYDDAELYARAGTIDNFLASVEALGPNEERPLYLLKRQLKRIEARLNPTDVFENLYDGQKVYYWSKCVGGIHSLEQLFLSSITMVAELKFNYGMNFIVYCLQQGKYSIKQHVTIVKENFQPAYKSPVVHIDVVDLLANLGAWLDKNRVGRKFNASPKHGMNGINNWPGEAKLYCANEGEAQICLNNAIPSVEWNDLYHYDRNKFMVFKNENFFVNDVGVIKIQYHGYHVENKDVPNQIPRDIQLRFRP